MKRVYSRNEEVAELWAAQDQDFARNRQGNFYFNGNTIYSYGRHFPIAMIENRFHRTFILNNSRRYSMTTNRHQSLVRWTISRSLSMWPCLDLPLYGDEVNFNGYLESQQTQFSQYIKDLQNTRKQIMPTREDFDNIIQKLNKVAYYLFNVNQKYKLSDFIRPVELDYLFAKVEERQQRREARLKWQQLFNCSPRVAERIVRQAS